MQHGILDELTLAADSAVELSEKNLEYLMKESKNATYDREIKEAYDEYEITGNGVKLYNRTTFYLSNSYRYNNYIHSSILLYKDNPEQIYYANHYNIEQNMERTNFVMEHYKEKILEMSECIDTRIEFLSEGNRLYMIRNIVDANFKPFAILIMDVNYEEVFKSIYGLPLMQESKILLGKNSLALEENEETILTEVVLESLDLNERPIIQLDTNEYLYHNSFVGGKHQYNVLMNTSLMSNMGLPIHIIVCLLILMLLPIVGLTIYVFYAYFSKPINELIHSASQIEAGELGYQVDVEPKSMEFQYLTKRFNCMSTSMKEQFELIYKEQEALQNAKIKALQSQINPHFLNNTLEVINWELRLGETQSAIEMIESLSTMLNASMARNEKSMKHLREELMYVDAYLNIISARMGKRITIIREIDDSATDYQVPLLILQPIVENAIEHGIANRTSGILTIRIYKTATDVVVEVENDGPLTKEDQERIQTLLSWDGNAEGDHIGHSSLGIRNVNQRLKLIFGENHGLTITTTEKYSTISRICFPIDQSCVNAQL